MQKAIQMYLRMWWAAGKGMSISEAGMKDLGFPLNVKAANI